METEFQYPEKLAGFDDSIKRYPWILVNESMDILKKGGDISMFSEIHIDDENKKIIKIKGKIKNAFKNLLTLLKIHNLQVIQKTLELQEDLPVKEVPLQVELLPNSLSSAPVYLFQIGLNNETDQTENTATFNRPSHLIDFSTMEFSNELRRQLLIENIREAHLLTDLDFNIIAFNNQFKNRFFIYFNKHLSVNKNFRFFLPDESILRIETAKSAIIQGESFSYKVNVKGEKEESNWLQIFFDPARNEKNEINGISISATNITQQLKLQQEQDILRETNQALFDVIPFPVWIYDPEKAEILGVNTTALQQYQVTREIFLRKENIDPELERKLLEIHKAQPPLPEEKIIHLGVFNAKGSNGDIIRAEISIKRIWFEQRNCLLVSENDITENEISYKISLLENKFLEDALKEDAGLQEVLNHYLMGIEEIFSGVKTSILKVQDNKVWKLIAPTLPDSFTLAFHGKGIGPEEGSCGKAAFTKKMVLVEDIENDESWKKYKEAPLGLGLKSCWSHPIFNAEGQVIATYSNYFPFKNQVPSRILETFKKSASLISVILESQRKNKALEISNNRHEYVTKATSDAIWDYDILTNHLYWGEGFSKLFQWDLEDKTPGIKKWSDKLHPEDSNRVHTLVGEIISGNENFWTQEYRFKKASGEYAYVQDKAYIIRDPSGQAIRIIGAIQDVSLQKNSEFLEKISMDIGQIFNLNKKLKTCLSETLDIIAGYTGFSFTEIWLPDESLNQINLVSRQYSDEYGKRFFEENPNFKSISYGEGVPGLVWKTKQILISDLDEIKDIFLRMKEADISGIKSIATIPLIYNHQVMGIIISGSSKDARFLLKQDLLFEQLTEKIGSEINRKLLEEELNNQFNYAPDLICIVDAENKFIKINPAGLRLLEFEESELIGQPFLKFVYKADLEKTIYESNLTHKGDRTLNFENRYITKTGKIIWLSWTSFTSPENKKIYAVAKDITQTKDLEDILKNASFLAKVGGWEVDLISGKHHWSAMTREIHEVDDSFEPDFEKAFLFYREEDQDSIRAIVSHCIQTGEDFDFEKQIITLKNNSRWVRVIGKTEFQNEVCVKISGSFQDIHERKLGEIELAKKSMLLDSMSKIIGTFLLEHSWEISIEEVLKLTGESLELKVVSFLEMDPEQSQNEKCFLNKYKWVDEKNTQALIHSLVPSITYREMEAFFPNITHVENINISIHDLQEGSLKQKLGKHSISSLILLPVFIHHLPVGLLFIIPTEKHSGLQEDAKNFLKGLQSNLAVALQRRKNKLALNTALDEKNRILETIGDGFFTTNNQWEITYWNKSAERTLGIKRENILFHKIEPILIDKIGKNFYELLRKAFNTKENIHFETFLLDRERWIDVSVYPHETGLAVYFTDISEHKQSIEKISQTNERFEKVTEATNDAIWDWDIKKDILFLGEGFNKLFGYQVKDLHFAIKHWKRNIHPEEQLQITEALEKIIENPSEVHWVKEYRFKKTNATYAYVQDRGMILRDESGAAYRLVGAMKDITYQKEYEKSLLQLTTKLEEFTKELQISNKELEQFAYVASHDLQEPLRMVTSYLSLLEKKYNPLFDEKAKQYIHFAVDGAKRMRQIILDLLEYSRVGKHEDKKVAVSLNKIVEEVQILQGKLIEEKKAVIICEKLPTIFIYRSPTIQLFNNLINNALKYSHQHIPPEIKITAGDTGSHWLISLEDNGIGIEKEYFDRIFIIFQRLHNRDQYTGTGMGLAIVKKIMDNLEGEILVNSNVGKGSIFQLKFKKENIL